MIPNARVPQHTAEQQSMDINRKVQITHYVGQLANRCDQFNTSDNGAATDVQQIQGSSRSCKTRYKSAISSIKFVSALLLAVVAILFATSCINRVRGIAPDPVRLHYPIGIAAHPSGKYLYVINANFDLAYTGGSIMVYDTSETRTDVFDRNGVKVELKTLDLLADATTEIGSFAGQIVINRSGDRAYIAVRQDRKVDSPIDVSSITVLDIDVEQIGREHLRCDKIDITKEQVGGVGDEEKFERDPPPRCGDKSKIILSQNPYPYSLDLIYECLPKRSCESDADCKCSETDQKNNLCQADQRCDFGRCVNGCSKDTCPTGEQCELGRCRSTNPDPNAKTCSTEGECGDGQRCDKRRCVPGCSRHPDCPDGETCSQGRCRTPLATTSTFCDKHADCTAWELCRETRLFASHLEFGGLTEVALAKDSKSVVFSGISTLPAGATSLSVLPPSTPLQQSGEIFISSNQDNRIFILPPQLPPTNPEALKHILFTNADYTNPLSYDLRGVTVGFDRKNKIVRLYVAVRRPAPSVLVYHLQRDPQTQKIQTLLKASIAVGGDPSYTLYRPMPSPHPDLLYVVCSRDGRVDVIDTQSMQIVHQIKTGQQPYFISIYDPPPGAAIQRRRAYVANFLESSVSIIDLDTHRVIGLIQGIDTRLPRP